MDPIPAATALSRAMLTKDTEIVRNERFMSLWSERPSFYAVLMQQLWLLLRQNSKDGRKNQRIILQRDDSPEALLVVGVAANLPTATVIPYEPKTLIGLA